MGQVDAPKMVEQVRIRLVDLAVSENYIRDSSFSAAARHVWKGSGATGGLVSDLWVEGAFPSEHSRDSLKSLSSEKLFPEDLCRHIHSRDVFPENRQLYSHQSEAIRKASSAGAEDKPVFVITAGTGLGKTEAFLLPMLSDLWTAMCRQKDGGMRCLILYPMNALVADQVDRIYRWLQGQHQLTVFHFTSATPEDARRANKAGEPKWESCRMRTRQEARGFETHDGIAIHNEPFGKVPDIVITNYSMLEYMLCRPQDSRFFGRDLRCIILDEAHLYSGTLAAEITMLLRRLRERCDVSPHGILQMATSATLGGSDDDLQTFASRLFSADKTRTFVIRGRYANDDLGNEESPSTRMSRTTEIAKYVDLDFGTMTLDDQLIEYDEETVRRLSEIAVCLVADDTVDRARKKYPGVPARFLYECLREAPLIRYLADILAEEKGSVIRLDDLASRLFDGKCGTDEHKATIALLRLSAGARLRPSELPLVPHRLHFLVRAPEGLSACLNPQCSGPDECQVSSIGCLQPLGDRCLYCGHILLPVHCCDNCGEWALAAHENQELSVLEPGYDAKNRTYYLLVQPNGHNLEEVVVDSEAGEIRGYGAAGVSLWKAPHVSAESQIQQCPTCHSSWTLDVDEEQQPE